MAAPGVHVDYLSRELAKTIEVEVRCFGDQHFEKGNLRVTGFELDAREFTCPKPLRSAFGAVRRCTDFNTTNIDADLVHCHTWYSHFGGILAKKNYGIPLVITVHSLEPLRPWKREQLGGGYDFSLWIEKTALEMADAIIAVSARNQARHRALVRCRSERVQVIHNGIDLDEYRKVDFYRCPQALRDRSGHSHICFSSAGSRDKKGIMNLFDAIQFMDPRFSNRALRGRPRHAGDRAGNESRRGAGRSQRPGIIWIDEMVDQRDR